MDIENLPQTLGKAKVGKFNVLIILGGIAVLYFLWWLVLALSGNPTHPESGAQAFGNMIGLGLFFGFVGIALFIIGAIIFIGWIGKFLTGNKDVKKFTKKAMGKI